MRLSTRPESILLILAIFINVSLSGEPTQGLPQLTDLSLKDITTNWEKKIPYLASPYLSSSPENLKDGIPVGQLNQTGVDSAKITAFAKEVFNEPANKRKDKSDSLLISYKGKLIFESYGRRGRVNLPHSQSSITTAYTALALGRVIELGYLTINDLKSPCVKYLTQLNLKKLPKGVESITIEEALTNHSGIRFIKPKKAKVRDKVYLGQKRIQAYLECIQPISPDSKKFTYQGFDAALIMQVIEAVVPGSAEHFIQTEVLGKLGITKYVWEKEKSDLPRSSGGTWLRSRDMLKIGMVFASHGKWNGEQLFSQEFMQKATSPLVKAYGPYDFGYFSWQRTIVKGDDSYMNIQLRGGKSGQLINIFPKQELIIVTTSHGNLQMIKDSIGEIIPAFK